LTLQREKQVSSGRGRAYIPKGKAVTAAMQFDTHLFARKLKGAGFEEPQVDALLELAVASTPVDFATKQDIAETQRSIADLRAATKQDIAETQQSIADLRAVTKQDIADLRAATMQDIAVLRAETKAEIAALDAKMATRSDLTILEQRMTIKLGAMLAFSVGLLITLERLLPPV
jgi:hypothetical protein